MGERLEYARERVADCMDRILKLFKPGARITVIVRSDSLGDKDFLMTNDDLDEVAAVVQRSKGRPDG